MVDDSTIAKVALLSRIKIDEKDFSSLRSDFDEIIKIFNLIDDANISDSDEIDGIAMHPVEIIKGMREDVPKNSDYKESALKLSSKSKGDYFKGPRCFE